MDKFDLKKLEKDPDAFLQRLLINDLEELFKTASDNYYNGPEELLSDNAFDAVEYYYRKKVGRDAKIEIGALPSKRLRIKLPYFMPSLDKVKVGETLNRFINSDSTFIYSHKIDGVSGMLVYENGEVLDIYLRGNGKIGGLISHVKDYINFPKTKNYSNLVVRGEFTIETKLFKKLKLGNKARNYIAGILNSKTPTEDLYNLDFVAYDIVNLGEGDEEIPRQSKCLRILQKEGFITVENGQIEKPLAADILNLYLQAKENSIYDIDGIVLSTKSSRVIPEKLENPKETVAFKINLQNQVRETEVIDIDWSISRNGKLTPVAVFKPVFIDGARIQRATAFNARKALKEWGLGKGSKITVTRSGGVIPKIVDVLSESDSPIEPSNKYPWIWKGYDIVLEDPDSCPVVLIKRIVHFFESLKIPGIREGMVTKMFDGGLNTLQQILVATPERLRQIHGIGPKRSVDFSTNIKRGIESAKIYKLMLASNTFGGTGLGKAFLRTIALEIPDFMKSREDLEMRLRSIRGIGPKRAEAFISGLKKFKKFCKDFPEIKSKKYIKNKNIDGKCFVLTNIEDEDFEDLIADHGGTIQASVTGSTTAVISGNLSDLTTKTKEAFKREIPIYTMDEFRRDFEFG